MRMENNQSWSCIRSQVDVRTIMPKAFALVTFPAVDMHPVWRDFVSVLHSSKSFSKIQESPASTSSSFLAGAKHDPGDKVDNGCSWLVWVQLGKEMADVVFLVHLQGEEEV
ncbi:hypothetical protein AAES_87436 [Amazona aestiva]|uniref:Uncharacterized protein n=1 Tax=Amazona aestiva TaxID=12930 RepID=A0A0Q3MPG3_AMAAE|nr:hypothetical protein AAES_87436 [Amazona aestiva]